MNLKWLSNIGFLNYNKKNNKQKFVRSRKRFRTITWKYTKTIGPFASFIYLFNQSIGSGLFDIPSLIDEVGWIPVIFGNVFVCSVAVFCSLMILRAMTMIPKNKNFEQRIEYSAVIKYFMSNEKYKFVSFLYHLGNICNNICGILVISKIIDIFIIKLCGYTILFQIYPQIKITKCSLNLLDAMFNGYYYTSTGGYERIMISGFTIGYLINAIICIHLSSKGLEETINYQYVVFMIFMSSFLYLSVSSTIYLLSQNYMDPSPIPSISNMNIYHKFILNRTHYETDLIKNYHSYNELNNFKKKLQLHKNPAFHDYPILKCITKQKKNISNDDLPDLSHMKDYLYETSEIKENIQKKKTDNIFKMSIKKNIHKYNNLKYIKKCPFFYQIPSRLYKEKIYIFRYSIFYIILSGCLNNLKIKYFHGKPYFFTIYQIFNQKNNEKLVCHKYTIKDVDSGMNTTFKEEKNYLDYHKKEEMKKKTEDNNNNNNNNNNKIFLRNLYYIISKIEGIKTYCMGKTFANFIDSYGFVSNIPSWGNEITDEVNVSKAIWLSSIFTSIFYFIFGLIFCLNNSFQKINTSILYIFNFVAVAPKVITGSISMRYDLMNLDICSDNLAFFFGCVAPFLFAWIFSNGLIFSDTFNYISLICGLFCNFLSPAFAYISACESNKYISKNPLRKYTIINRKKTVYSSSSDIRKALGNIIVHFDVNNENVNMEESENEKESNGKKNNEKKLNEKKFNEIQSNEKYKQYNSSISLDHYSNSKDSINDSRNASSYFKYVNGEYKLKSYSSNEDNQISQSSKNSSTNTLSIYDNIYDNDKNYKNDNNDLSDVDKNINLNNYEITKTNVPMDDNINNEENFKNMKKKKKKGVMFSDIVEEYCEESNSNVKKKHTSNVEDIYVNEKVLNEITFSNESKIMDEENIQLENKNISLQNKKWDDNRHYKNTKKKLMFSDDVKIFNNNSNNENKKRMKKKGVTFMDELEEDKKFEDPKKNNNEKNDNNKNNNNSKNNEYNENKKKDEQNSVLFSGDVKREHNIYNSNKISFQNKPEIIFSNNIKVINENNNDLKNIKFEKINDKNQDVHFLNVPQISVIEDRKNEMNYSENKVITKVLNLTEYERNFSDSFVNFKMNRLDNMTTHEEEFLKKNRSFENHEQVYKRQREKLKSHYKNSMSKVIENSNKYNNLIKDIEALNSKDINENNECNNTTIEKEKLNIKNDLDNPIFIFNTINNDSNDKTLITETLDDEDNNNLNDENDKYNYSIKKDILYNLNIDKQDKYLINIKDSSDKNDVYVKTYNSCKDYLTINNNNNNNYNNYNYIDDDENVCLLNSKYHSQMDLYHKRIFSSSLEDMCSKEISKNENMNSYNLSNFLRDKNNDTNNISHLNDFDKKKCSSCEIILPQKNDMMNPMKVNVINISNENMKNDIINNNDLKKYEKNTLFVRHRKKLKSSFHANGDMIIGDSKEAIHKEQINEFLRKISKESIIYNNYDNVDPIILNTSNQNDYEIKKENINISENKNVQSNIKLQIPTINNIRNTNEKIYINEKNPSLNNTQFPKIREVTKHKTNYKFGDLSDLANDINKFELNYETNKNENYSGNINNMNNMKNIDLHKNDDINSENKDCYNIITRTNHIQIKSDENTKLNDKEQNDILDDVSSEEIEKSDVIKTIEKVYTELANKMHSENSENDVNNDDDIIDCVDIRNFKIIDNKSPVKYYYNSFHKSKILENKKYDHIFSNNIMIDNKTNMDHLCSVFLFGNPLERNEEDVDKKKNTKDNDENTKTTIDMEKSYKITQDKSDNIKNENKKTISFNLSESESNELPNRAFSRNFTNSNGIIKKTITGGNNSINFKGLTLRKSNINSITDHESIDYKELNEIIDSNDKDLNKNMSDKIEIMKIRIHVYPYILQKYHVETTYVLLGCLTTFSFVGIITDLLFG
ncbi:amino acid transporter, putative [Plasmodium gaboni]|uniref:Amino acid transporter, putative n=1 Tax=Plasmodium gaboni TaxID=647221 RepID=A0ABY1URI3_9APIC|nr:amino acid transporter, putative [Plasmodium gaboni]